MPTYTRGDYGFDITFNLINSDGTPFNLTGATSILFRMKNVDTGTIKVSGSCTIVDAPNGICKYTVQVNDFDTVGDYLAEVEVSFANKIVTFRQPRYRIFGDV